MFNNIKDNKGFTLIELIMVTIILGILSAVAVPRYLGTVTKAEEAAEDAVIAGIKAGLSNYAMEQMFSGGRKTWPDHPFTGLDTSPAGYDATDTDDADTDREWTFNTTTSKITHQRGDNTRWSWTYNKGVQTGDDAAIGSIGARVAL